MSERMVHCVKLNQDLPGLKMPPYPGELGQRIWREISQQAWNDWIAIQTRLVNENRLNLADSRARKWLALQMENYLFNDAHVEAQGFTPQ